MWYTIELELSSSSCVHAHVIYVGLVEKYMLATICALVIHRNAMCALLCM